MANHKSAMKRARQNTKRRARNTAIRSHTKTLVKEALELIQKASSREEALAALCAGERVLQKAASKGAVPKTRASRKTSRLAALVERKFAS